MQAKNVMLQAAQVIRERGHTKNALANPSKEFGMDPRKPVGVCLFGALNCVLTGNPELFPGEGPDRFKNPESVPERVLLVDVRDRLVKFLDLDNNEPLDGADAAWWNDVGKHSALVSWNNALARTADEVIAALEGAANA